MCHPLVEHSPHVAFTEQDHKIQALTSNAADQSLAERVGLRRPDWRLQNGQTHRGECRINVSGLDAVPVMK
jgi:hypothetical protein